MRASPSLRQLRLGDDGDWTFPPARREKRGMRSEHARRARTSEEEYPERLRLSVQSRRKKQTRGGEGETRRQCKPASPPGRFAEDSLREDGTNVGGDAGGSRQRTEPERIARGKR